MTWRGPAHLCLLAVALLTAGTLHAEVIVEPAPVESASLPTAEEDKPNRTNSPQPFARLLAEANAAQATGQSDKAFSLLNQALDRAKQSHAEPYRALALANLSDAYLRVRRLDEALTHAQEAADAARRGVTEDVRAAVLNHLGNALAAQKRHDEALQAYQEGIDLTARCNDAALAATLMTNALHVLVAKGDFRSGSARLATALTKVRALPASADQAMRLVALSHLAQRLAVIPSAPRDALLRQSAEALADARQLSERFNDSRLNAYTFGHLGELATLEDRLADADALLHRALFFSAQAGAPELSARWYRQLGKLREARQDIAGAKTAYRQSLQQLAAIRSALVFGYRGMPESFKDTVGGTYLDLAALLLRQSRGAPSPEKAQPALREVRDVLESFKAAELQNYFLDECVTTQRERQKGREPDALIEPGAAVLYTISFPDRLVLLAHFSGGDIRHFEVPVGAAELAESVGAFRKQLAGAGNPRRLRTAALELYEWLLKPVEPELSARRIKTLIIASDDALRAVPFAALFDGENFLVERYAFAVSPGLSLTETADVAARSSQALLGGISQSVQGFGELPKVTEEISDVAQLYESRSLIDDRFVKSQIQSELARTPFGIVSFATHAKISGDPRQSFLLTYDGRMDLDELEAFVRTSQFRKQPVELLVLSACDTAEGDERAALGLAGVAVKAGARSVMASLWAVNDASTATLVPQFFKNLQDGNLNKAQALQQAQKALLADSEYREPYHWAPFVLIGNWR